MESKMIHSFLLFFFFTTFIICNSSVDARNFKVPRSNTNYGIRKLFVFGDSYADTGNLHFMWQREPYGHSMGKPRGRYSDGLIFTDFLAKFLGLKSPPPYHWRHNVKQELHYGMNFAYGGAGVNITLFPRPNISTQINFFEDLLKDNVYTSYDLESALFLVTLSGNDYDKFLADGHEAKQILLIYKAMLDSFSMSLERLSKLGAKRVAVGSLQAVGCLPTFTGPDYKKCNESGEALVLNHNGYLQDKIDILNNRRLTTSYSLLNFNGSFGDTISNKRDVSGKLNFPDPLRPCCTGTCGEVDASGQKLYEVCVDPKSSFFWDSVHPTQAGWQAVFEALKPAIADIAGFIA